MSADEKLRQDEELAFDLPIDETPQKLWRALTEPSIVERWLAPVVARGSEPSSPDHGLSCQLIATETNRFARYIWRDPEAGASIVTFSVSERGDGFSRLSIVHEGLPRSFTIASAGATASAAAPRHAANGNRPLNNFPPLLLAA